MAENSGIGWTDHTMNFWWGCNKVSAECTHCYIRNIMKRGGREPFNGPIRTKNWTKPATWNRRAAREGRRFRVFTCSMSDFFHEGADDWRPEAWSIMQECNRLDWLVLTKRPERILTQLPPDWGQGYRNVWLGVTCGATESLWRLDALKDIPAVGRFVSAEPLLESVNFTPYLDGAFKWIITGCEQAHLDKRRAMDMNWVRNIDRQCRRARIAHFFKQRYDGSKILYDGMIDGVTRQNWPAGLR